MGNSPVIQLLMSDLFMDTCYVQVCHRCDTGVLLGCTRHRTIETYDYDGKSTISDIIAKTFQLVYYDKTLISHQAWLAGPSSL